MTTVLVSLLLIIALAAIARSEKIAVFVVPLSNSQVVFTLRLAEELAEDHDVVIVRPFFNNATNSLVSKHPRVREIRHRGCSKENFDTFTEYEHKWIYGEPPFLAALEMGEKFANMFTEACHEMVNDDEFITKLRKERFDFAFLHHIDLCNVGIVRAAEIPQWGVALSTPLFRSMLKLVGVPVLPPLLPNLLTDGSNQMAFVTRAKNFAFELFCDLMYPVTLRRYTNLFRAKFGPEFPDVGQLGTSASLLLANSHPDIEFPVPVTSKVAFVGGLGLSNATQPLKEPYASFVNKSQKTVFVSFGTVADSSLMPVAWRDALVELFRRNPDVNFIWKMEDEVEVPKNVLRGRWHPQKDLLGHDKVVAFITHGGYNSIGESIASATPILTIPLFGDQFRNSRLAMYRKFGVRVDKQDFTADHLHQALHRLLDEPSFLASAKEVRSVFFSSPISPGNAARHALRFALDHPDYDRDIPRHPLYALYSLDMIALLGLAAFVVLFVVWRILKCYYWSCCLMAYKEKEKIQ